MNMNTAMKSLKEHGYIKAKKKQSRESLVRLRLFTLGMMVVAAVFTVVELAANGISTTFLLLALGTYAMSNMIDKADLMILELKIEKMMEE